jgi:hypothetical protein
MEKKHSRWSSEFVESVYDLIKKTALEGVIDSDDVRAVSELTDELSNRLKEGERDNGE